MVHKYFFPQSGVVDMQINLGGSYAFMSEHLLYGSEIGPSFEQVCGK